MVKKLNLGGKLPVSEVALGCMSFSQNSDADADRLLGTALEQGIDYFDNADIYGGGKCEEAFGAAVKRAGCRAQIRIQTKCAIRRGQYDFSKEHIISSVEGSLSRLGVDYIDVLLLHRPDTLMEPSEVAEAFNSLRAAGKVRFFGVSNHNPGQIRLLSEALGERLLANQLQFSVAHSGMIDSGLNVNIHSDPACDRDGGILEYCRFHNITIQAWSPFRYGFFEGLYMGDPKYEALNKELAAAGEKYGVTPSAAAIAWILRHPARIQPIVGTSRADRLADICAASGVEMSREDWYKLYLSAGNRLP